MRLYGHPGSPFVRFAKALFLEKYADTRLFEVLSGILFERVVNDCPGADRAPLVPEGHGALSARAEEEAMQYALLFYHPPASEIPAPERDRTLLAMLEEMRAWQAELERAGVFRTTLALAGTEAATSLRGEGGKVLVSDGPFAETKEILGGLAILECADLDEARGWARRCPLVRIGTIEVRPAV